MTTFIWVSLPPSTYLSIYPPRPVILSMHNISYYLSQLPFVMVVGYFVLLYFPMGSSPIFPWRRMYRPQSAIREKDTRGEQSLKNVVCLCKHTGGRRSPEIPCWTQGHVSSLISPHCPRRLLCPAQNRPKTSFHLFVKTHTYM